MERWSDETVLLFFGTESNITHRPSNPEGGWIDCEEPRAVILLKEYVYARHKFAIYSRARPGLRNECKPRNREKCVRTR